MGQVSNYRLLPVRHFRGNQSSVVLRYRKGAQVSSRQGDSFFFRPLNTQIVEVPVTDQEQPFNFRAQSADFQDLLVQGTIIYSLSPTAAERVDFSVDLDTGTWSSDPREQIESMLTQMAQQTAWSYIASTELADLLVTGMAGVRDAIANFFAGPGATELTPRGITVSSVRVITLAPKPEVQSKLETKVFERLSMEADDVVFERRTRATENEVRIQKADQANRINLEEQRAELIGRQAENARAEAESRAAVAMLQANNAAEVARVNANSAAEATKIRSDAELAAEKDKMAAYAEVPGEVRDFLRAQGLAAALGHVESLSIVPSLFEEFLLSRPNGTGEATAAHSN